MGKHLSVAEGGMLREQARAAGAELVLAGQELVSLKIALAAMLARLPGACVTLKRTEVEAVIRSDGWFVDKFQDPESGDLVLRLAKMAEEAPPVPAATPEAPRLVVERRPRILRP